MPPVILPWLSRAALQEACTKLGTGKSNRISTELGELRAPLNRQWKTISEAAKQLRLQQALLTEILRIIMST